MDWKGANEEWSNGYHLSVDTVPDHAGMGAIVDAIWNGTEKLLVNSQVFLTSALAYSDPGANSDHTFVFGRPGQAGDRAGTGAALGSPLNSWQKELCLLVKAQAGRTSKGRQNYLTKYYHACSGPTGDSASGLTAAVNAAATKLIDGTLPSAAKWCTPGGTVATGIGLDPWIRVHQLKRRGKRP
jgi:hypothetical protein